MGTMGPGPGTVTDLPPGGASTLPGGGGITTGPQGSATLPGQTTGSGGQGTGTGTGTPGQDTGSPSQGTGTAGQGSLTTLPTTTSPGSITGPTIVPITDIALPAGRNRPINLRLYLRDPNDSILSLTTDPPVSWAVLSGTDLLINAPDTTSEYTLVIRVLAANAQGVPYEIVLNLKIEPVVPVPITAGNAFSIDLSKYLESTADAATIATDPNAPWVQYSKPIQRIAGSVPADYKEPSTLITASVTSQKGGTYVRYFALVISPVPVVPLALGGQLALQLTPYLIASEDVVPTITSNPNATWVQLKQGDKSLSGIIPRTLDYKSVIVTVFANSFTKGLEYSFQLELYIQDSSQPDTPVSVPVVASNNFTITTTKYFPASVRLSAISTVPQVSWISFDPAKSTVSGKVPDLLPGTIIKLTVNASSAAAPGSAAATYSKLYNLEVQPNDVPRFNVTLGAQFGEDLVQYLLSPNDYLTSISTLPVSNWVSLGTNGKTIGGIVPLNIAAGSTIAVAAIVVNPTLDSSYNKDFSLDVLAGQSVKIPVLYGNDFQVNFTDLLRNPLDSVEFTTSPPIDWIRKSPTPPPSLIGTVPIGFEGSEVNITIIATSRTNGFTYTILAALQVFTNQAKVDIFQSEVLFFDLRPLLKSPEDLVEDIEKFPAAPWLVLDRANKTVSGTVPLDQPSGSTVNITVNGLSLQQPTRSIGRLRGPMRAIAPRQMLLYFPYSVSVSIKIFDRPVVISSSISTTIIQSTIEPSVSTPPQPSEATLSSDGQLPSSPPEIPTSSDGGQMSTGPGPTQNPPESSNPPAETSGGPQQPTSSMSGIVGPGSSAQPPSSGGNPPSSGLPSFTPSQPVTGPASSVSLPPGQSTSSRAAGSQPGSASVVIPSSPAGQTPSSPAVQSPSSPGGQSPSSGPSSRVGSSMSSPSVASPIISSPTSIVLPPTAATTSAGGPLSSAPGTPSIATSPSAAGSQTSNNPGTSPAPGSSSQSVSPSQGPQSPPSSGGSTPSAGVPTSQSSSGGQVLPTSASTSSPLNPPLASTSVSSSQQNPPLASTSLSSSQQNPPPASTSSTSGLLGTSFSSAPTAPVPATSVSSSVSVSPVSTSRVSTSSQAPTSSVSATGSASTGAPTSSTGSLSTSSQAPTSSTGLLSTSSQAPTSSTQSLSTSSQAPTSSTQSLSTSSQAPTSSVETTSSVSGTSSISSVSFTMSETSSASSISSESSEPIPTSSSSVSQTSLATTSASSISSESSESIPTTSSVSHTSLETTSVSSISSESSGTIPTTSSVSHTSLETSSASSISSQSSESIPTTSSVSQTSLETSSASSVSSESSSVASSAPSSVASSTSETTSLATSASSSASGPLPTAQIIPKSRSGSIYPSPNVLVLYFRFHHAGPDNFVGKFDYALHRSNKHRILKPYSKPPRADITNLYIIFHRFRHEPPDFNNRSTVFLIHKPRIKYFYPDISLYLKPSASNNRTTISLIHKSRIEHPHPNVHVHCKYPIRDDRNIVFLLSKPRIKHSPNFSDVSLHFKPP